VGADPEKDQGRFAFDIVPGARRALLTKSAAGNPGTFTGTTRKSAAPVLGRVFLVPFQEGGAVRPGTGRPRISTTLTKRDADARLAEIVARHDAAIAAGDFLTALEIRATDGVRHADRMRALSLIGPKRTRALAARAFVGCSSPKRFRGISGPGGRDDRRERKTERGCRCSLMAGADSRGSG
jgi:hypothetical protein